jgi:hypothetical protein
MSDGEIGFAPQDRQAFQIVAGDRLLRVGDIDPSFAQSEAGNALPLRDVLLIIPVMKFVFMRIGEIECDQQNALGHCFSPSLKWRYDPVPLPHDPG